jgi:hypothetical protein
MNTERIQQRLGVETSKQSVNTDTYLNINLDGEQRLLPPNEINHIVNVGDRFNVERQRSKFYRVIGTINPTISNVLMDLTDSANSNLYTLKGFNDIMFLDTSYPPDNNTLDLTDLTYQQAIKTKLLEKEGWFGYYDPDITKQGLCNWFDMEPKRERFTFYLDKSPYHATPNQAPIKNWELTITYPSSVDSGHTMVNGGLMIVEAVPVIVSTRQMTAIGMACLHNLQIGDLVRIVGTTGYDGDHVVVRTGLDNGDLKDYYFVIDKLPTGTVNGNSRIKRLYGGIESIYYFRKFKKIKTRNTAVIENDDYETYPLSFSENIFTDPIEQFVFNEDINISDLRDNLNRPLSEIYLTVVKTSSNGLFNRVSSGIETPLLPKLLTSNTNTWLQQIPTINRIHNGVSTPFVSSVPLEPLVNISPMNDEFYGDLVEYNIAEVKETILAHVSHRFNTASRELGGSLTYNNTVGSTTPTTTTVSLGPRQEGYLYKAHHMIKIRQFSSYIETGDNFTEGIPEYAINLGDGRYLWRDLLDIGFNESDDQALDYPFLNGCHYMYDNYCFSVRRQDAFAQWGLYWSTFPADPIGDALSDKFEVKSEEDVC